MPHAIIRGKTDDDARLTLTMRLFLSRFIPAKRRSRFLSRRIPKRSPSSGGASPFSTFPGTSLAKPPAQQRDVPQSLNTDAAFRFDRRGHSPAYPRHLPDQPAAVNPDA